MIALEQTTLAQLEFEAKPIENQFEVMLVARLRVGDLSAFDDLVGYFERPVFSVCLRLLGDVEDARDAAQETFLKVYRGLHSFRGEAGLKTWIYRIAINQAMNQQRWWKRRRRDETISLELSRKDSDITLENYLCDASASPETRAIEQERERKILRALSEVQKDYRAALILREIEELSYEEIAETLEISIGTVKSRIARGREELRRKLKELV